MKETHVLKTGDELVVNAKSTVTITKCGMHSEGGGIPAPTVTVEVSDETKPALQTVVEDAVEPAEEAVDPQDIPAVEENS